MEIPRTELNRKVDKEKPYENIVLPLVKVSTPKSIVPIDNGTSSKSITRGGSNSRCPCCGDPYSRLLRQGRVLLSCLHPVCTACVRLAADLLVSLRGNEECDASGNIGFFLCPFCHWQTPLGRKRNGGFVVGDGGKKTKGVRPINAR